MHDLPSFLRYLEVPADADERTIRRAYATLLKQIDQASEADQFQRLREAYEAALQWVAEGSSAAIAQALNYGPATVPVRLKMPGDVSPRDTAATALRCFLAQVDGCGGAGSLAIADVMAALHQALASEALVGLEARYLFEAQFAAHLAQGWRPGHEILFPVVCQVFGWADDGQRVRRLGTAGEFLDLAIGQEAAFARQSEDDVAMRHAVLARLRDAEMPDEQFMWLALPHFEQMMDYMPQWLAVLAPGERVARWREHYAEALRYDRDSSLAVVDEHERRANRWQRRMLLVTVILPVLLVLVIAVAKTLGERSDSANVKRLTVPAAPSGPYVSPAPLWSAELPERFRQQIYSRIRYAGASKLAQGVTFEVALTDGGHIVTLRKLASSGDEGFDEAVALALTASQPFPPSLNSRLYVGIDPGKVSDSDPKP